MQLKRGDKGERKLGLEVSYYFNSSYTVALSGKFQWK